MDWTAIGVVAAVALPAVTFLGWVAYNHPTGWQRISFALGSLIGLAGGFMGGYSIGIGNALRVVANPTDFQSVREIALPLWTLAPLLALLLLTVFLNRLRDILGKKVD